MEDKESKRKKFEVLEPDKSVGSRNMFKKLQSAEQRIVRLCCTFRQAVVVRTTRPAPLHSSADDALLNADPAAPASLLLLIITNSGGLLLNTINT